MPDKLDFAEQQLAELTEQITAENYAAAAKQVGSLQKTLQQLFSISLTAAEQKRLTALSQSFLSLLASLNEQQQQLKHSIGQMAGVKSGNKVSKTYQTD